jgi:hypothetical protein
MVKARRINFPSCHDRGGEVPADNIPTNFSFALRNLNAKLTGAFTSMLFDHRYQRSRYELKYLVDEPCARRVRDFVRGHLRRDPFARPQMRYAYPIYSLYLDDAGLAMFRASTQGQKNRVKLRIRYYDLGESSPLFLEIKRRVNDVVCKERAIIRRDALASLLAGCCPRTDHLFDPEDGESHSVLREFCRLRNLFQADGRMIVYYEREAWVAPDDENVRVTFDRSAAATHYRASLDPQPAAQAAIDSVILELKFDDRYPLWMRELARTCDLYRTKMGKYVFCMEQIPRPARPFGFVATS